MSFAMIAAAKGEVKIEGKTTVPVFQFVELKAAGDITGAGFTWKVYDSSRHKLSMKSIKVTNGSITFVAPPGTYTVELTSYRYIEKDKKIIVDEADVLITVSGEGPAPPPPPPNPESPTISNLIPAIGPVGTSLKVTGTKLAKASAVKLGTIDIPKWTATDTELVFQVPVGAKTGKVSITAPTGSVTSAANYVVSEDTDPPIPGDGLRVLIIYESSEVTKYPQAQQAIISGAPFRKFLDTSCVIGPDGKSPERRIYDKDADTSAEDPKWGKAMERAKKTSGFKTPWILVSNGKTGYEGPLPENVEKATELIKKYTPSKK